MGAKESKGSTQRPKEIHISASQMIDPSDPTLFPNHVQEELLAVQAEIPSDQLFFVKEFNQSSRLVQWLHQCTSYFDFHNEEIKPTGVAKNKDPFLAQLQSMCDSPSIPTKFVANLLETADRFLLAFINTGHIAGFMIFGEDDNPKRKCLHRYITCTGPRGLGIGIALVNEIHAIAKKEGFTCVTLGASGSEGFHTKMGYRLTGKTTIEGPEMIYQIPLKGGKRRSKTRKSKRRTGKVEAL